MRLGLSDKPVISLGRKFESQITDNDTNITVLAAAFRLVGHCYAQQLEKQPGESWPLLREGLAGAFNQLLDLCEAVARGDDVVKN